MVCRKWVLVIIMIPFLCFSQYSEYEWEERDEWMPVERIFELSEIEPGMHVADIGCHEGYFSVHLSNAVGAKGQVFAVDVRSDRLNRLRNHLDDRDISNVKVILGDYDDPKLPEASLDVVMIIDTYHEMTSYRQILKHVYKALKPGGKLVILEKLKQRVRDGSRKEQTDAHTLAPNFVRREMKAANFIIIRDVRDLGNWEEDKKKPMWMLVAEKSAKTKWSSDKL